VYTRPKQNVIVQVIVLERKRRPCKMSDSVRQKLGHTKIKALFSTLCENENERQKTEPVPIPLPRAA
jgi:hypothetical protein